MSIRKFFKPIQKDVILPNLHGPLSSEVPPGAIEAANERVSETIQSSGSGSGSTSNTARGPYTKLTAAQRLMIGKRASEYGTTAAMKYFAKKYPGEFWFSKRDHSSTPQEHIPGGITGFRLKSRRPYRTSSKENRASAHVRGRARQAG